MNNSSGVDIVKKITYIEGLKCRLLSQTANLFESMANGSASSADKKDILSELLISTYLLSEQMGVSFEAIDHCAVNRLKASLACNENNSAQEKLLIQHLLGRISAHGEQ